MTLIFSVAIQEMLMSTSDEATRAAQRIIMKEAHKEELKEYDKRIILELDQKVGNLIE